MDDSTKQIYGPKTTKFIREENLLNNTGDYQTIDTSIYLLERQSVVDRNAREFQNLGVIGTPTFSVFHVPQQAIGRSSGFNAYSNFAFDPSIINYYDTKSPYFDLFGMLGGGNRNIIDIGFSRNVNPNWNVGFKYRRLTVDKQLARDGQGDRQVEGAAFAAYTHYKHAKVPYQLLFHYSQLNHNAVDLGGVRFLDTDSSRTDLFQYEIALLRLEDAQTNVKDRRIHLFQEYQLAEQLQLYHVLDRHTEQHTYEDFSGSSSTTDYNTYTDFYPNFFVDEDSTYQRANFSSFSNEAGIKGDISNVFYRTFLRFRWVDFDYNYLDPEFDAFEQYIGGYLRFKWREKFSVVTNGAYIVGGGYDFKGTLSSTLLNAYYRTSNYAVPFIYNRYFGNHHEWSNSFEPTFTNQLGGNVNLRSKFFELVPTVDFTSYQNYLYFDQNRQPVQNTGTFVISKLGGNLNLRFLNSKGEGWHLENQAFYTRVAGDGAAQVRIPEIFFNGRFFWRGNWFDDLVPFEVGVDTHARSAYFANSYAPEIQQFYLQDEYEIEGYFKADLFLNMRLDKFFLSLKWTHIDQPNDGGYFASPYYPGQPRVLDVNVKWRFFD